MNENYEVVICIVNHGFTDLVMEAAKAAGARGGTVINGRGTGNKDAETFFGVTVTPDKEMAMILVPKAIRDDVLSAVNKGAGMNTKGMGIAFSIPASNVVGIGGDDEEEKKPAEK